MNTILVTGGAGFIGSHLCEKLLLRGFHVLCLDNFNDSYEPAVKRDNLLRALRHSHFRLVEGDITDTALVDSIAGQPDIAAVVHLAALAGVRSSIRLPLEYIDVDIKGTAVLLEACKKYGIKRFVFASSSSVYGSSTPPFRENDPLAVQTSPYAAAKQSGELFCRTYSHLYGIRTACLRFFTVYGPRQRPDMAVHLFTKAVDERHELRIFGSGDSSRDYTYIDDITDGIVAALDLQSDFEIFNLGSGNAVHIKALVETIENRLGKRANIQYLPEQQGDAPATCADISKAAALLGYRPKVGLEEGIDRFVDWYKRSRKTAVDA